ncbi:Crp/Fnr family transcriptional regulator [Cohnella cellulosilytica]|uniref:Crp/Fnr family transcriptional regulator n=1 Tax=Cohnella cellulosilytica TaxID=986710 RepID=A0ABW2F516_9BACL
MSKEKTSAFLRQVPLFHDLNPQEMERVEEITISRFIPRKSVIFAEGSEKEAVYFIKNGLVKTYKTDENGHEQIVSFLKTGDLFPHTGFFNQNPYPATAEAIVDTRLLAIPVKVFERLMLNTPSIAIKMMRVMGDKIRELQEKLQVLSGQDVKHRVLSFLLQLAEQHGDVQDNKITINLPMTHQEIANSIGTTRETINRLLNQFNKEDLLEVDRSRIVIIDLEALKQLKELR